MKIGILMDPLSSIKPKKDSTVVMIQSAQTLGFDCFYFTLHDLFCRDGHAYARVSTITVANALSSTWAQCEPLGEQPLTMFDVILMRKDPPFDLEYIYATYALELAEKAGVFISNKPNGLRAANEKYVALHFPQCCPPTLVSRDVRRLRSFWELHRTVVFKPLDGMGGCSVFHVDEQGSNLSVILEVLTRQESVSIMAQHYIPAIRTLGDKRILLVNGEPMPYGLARIPPEGELRGNLAAGGQGKVVEITDRDRWICSELAPTLREHGLHFVGIDVIGDYLTEINVTSPTCIRQIESASGIAIASRYLNYLYDVWQSR